MDEFEQPVFSDVGEVETANNRATRANWALYTEHRNQVTALVRAFASVCDMPRLGILGAGNINDLDLVSVLDLYSSVTLFDMDCTAVRDGVERQWRAAQLGGRNFACSQINIVAPIDLTGIASLIAPNMHRRLDTRELADHSAQIVRRVASTSAFASSNDSFLPLPRYCEGAFDVVVSSCLLSQLVRQVTDSFANSECAPGLIQTVVGQHLELIAALTRPGGKFIVITDFANSATAPYLQSTASAIDLNDIADKILGEDKQFISLAPHTLINMLDAPTLAHFIDQIDQSSYWTWTIGPLKTYLCYALQVARSQTAFNAADKIGSSLLARIKSFSTRTGIPLNSCRR